MNCDLERLFGKLGHKLPHETDGEHEFTFSSKNLPKVTEPIATNRLYLKKGTHQWAYGFRYDKLQFHSHKETYRLLGLLILAKVFHPFTPNISLTLNHPVSEVAMLIIEYSQEKLGQLSSGYATLPYGFVYYPEVPQRHPFYNCSHETSPIDLPCFGLTNKEDCLINEKHWRNRDVVIIHGTDKGLVNFAELLLNAGGDSNHGAEFILEGEGGFRGVGIHSAEVSLHLPGSLAWEQSDWT